MAETKEKAKKVNLDIIGVTAMAIITIGRFILSRISGFDSGHTSRIMLVWKRQDVSVETKERGEEYIEKLYPQLVSKSLQDHNWLYKYRIPTGLSSKKLRDSIDDIEFDLKSKIIFEVLENDEKAHFSLTVSANKSPAMYSSFYKVI